MKKIILFSSATALLLLMGGCQGGGNASYVDSSGPRTVVSLDKINIQDWENAANQMIDSLLSSGVVERAPQQPAVMAVSRIVNNTTQVVDTNMLTKKIRIALNRSGKVVTTTTFGADGNVEDQLAKETGAYQATMQGNMTTNPSPIPYYSLSGRIIEDRARAGNTRQVTYVFQMSLTTTQDGLAVWEDEVMITKQGSRASVGW
ncbi:penicillin-binding protein activator LpoB [Ruficoccus sp. ZRK36]|uniref:penicillin-binding protein activator LpoB n=1 Tax=Ruficoccus sp. ZRK36 TaxID=2866311 RepID=UPI001C72E09C|nr:penicillin-binding protein activator LpoB [Ruficoccus sp. ZRK36]QYY35111.1 penicillin-binding protein activator LpoB [Ruficoccus sp. ZRK36]